MKELLNVLLEYGRRSKSLNSKLIKKGWDGWDYISEGKGKIKDGRKEKYCLNAKEDSYIRITNKEING